MEYETNRSCKSSLMKILHFLLLCGAIGVIIGMGFAATGIVANDYFSLKFYRTISIELTAHTINKLGVATALGFGIIILRMLWALLSAKNRWFRAFVDRSSKGNLPYKLCWYFILIFLLFRVALYGSTGRLGTMVVVLAGVAWCLSVALYRRKTMDLEIPRWFQSRSFVRDFCCMFVFFVFVLLSLNKPNISVITEHIEITIAFAASVFLAVITFVCGFIPLYRLDISKACPYKLPKQSVFMVPLLLIVLSIPILCKFALAGISDTCLQAGQPYNVIVIGIDTLRADRIPASGKTAKGRNLMPNLNALAAEGTIFENAISQSIWTTPAFSSIFTGKYPHQHGAISYPRPLLRDKETTLAEIMREAGYLTAAVISNYYVGSKCGLDQGYVYYNENNMSNPKSITSQAVTDDTIAFLEKHGDKRFFLFAHYFDPHSIYMDHQEFNYADKYAGLLKKFSPAMNTPNRFRAILGPVDIDYITDLYDEEVAYTDKHVGRLIDYINKHNLKQNTMLVVVSDHGEEFMEHGLIGHLGSIRRQVIHVPMFIVLPEIEHKTNTVSQIVETRNIFPSILDFIKLPYDIEDSAFSLIPLTQTGKETDSYEKLNYAFTVHDGSYDTMKMSSLWTDQWRLMVHHDSQKEFLFDVQKDLHENKNLIDEKPEILAELRRILYEWLRKMEVSDEQIFPHSNPTQKEIQRLKSLGYL